MPISAVPSPRCQKMRYNGAESIKTIVEISGPFMRWAFIVRKRIMRDLTLGAVILLYTDLEGSTSQLQQLRDHYAGM